MPLRSRINGLHLMRPNVDLHIVQEEICRALSPWKYCHLRKKLFGVLTFPHSLFLPGLPFSPPDYLPHPLGMKSLNFRDKGLSLSPIQSPSLSYSPFFTSGCSDNTAEWLECGLEKATWIHLWVCHTLGSLGFPSCELGCQEDSGGFSESSWYRA